ncbi:hypothetical protein [Alienimonas californiensis]|uniref:Uncharacterized protein n=1 Tax=Alienimonas californiensis TaxID=2527989 RepID=A0A517PBK9_9PLAN|nr:hypothetical protein [Alienimonas californiensis]QDT16741.1 hypothetical protein CA12_28480 [Alienimonas californiensis]
MHFSDTAPSTAKIPVRPESVARLAAEYGGKLVTRYFRTVFVDDESGLILYVDSRPTEKRFVSRYRFEGLLEAAGAKIQATATHGEGGFRGEPRTLAWAIEVPGRSRGETVSLVRAAAGALFGGVDVVD